MTDDRKSDHEKISESVPANDFLLRNQSVILNIGAFSQGRGSNVKYLPYAFTEQGVAMLSSVLRSARAVEVNSVSAPWSSTTRALLNWVEPGLGPRQGCGDAPRSPRGLSNGREPEGLLLRNP
ncbi:MAG: ORF6N domain-containing protein [Deltaproteobacteria bacterium]|nr:ORF6N domain-containing protein [Deltaproteobacteria bacterium]